MQDSRQEVALLMQMFSSFALQYRHDVYSPKAEHSVLLRSAQAHAVALLTEVAGRQISVSWQMPHGLVPFRAASQS